MTATTIVIIIMAMIVPTITLNSNSGGGVVICADGAVGEAGVLNGRVGEAGVGVVVGVSEGVVVAGGVAVTY